MRSSLAIAAAVLAATAARAEPAPKSERERQSYALGMELGRKVRSMPLDVDPGMVSQGVADALGGTSLLSDDEVRTAVAALQAEAKTRQAAALATRVGQAFLAANAKKEGVVTLPSGLQYKVLKAGTGKKPADADAVKCHYRGFFVDGTEFDSSYKRGDPATLKVKGGEVIAGWSEALRLMPAGSKWQLVVPPQLAYGERGSMTVGPNATLIYELELLAVD